MKLTRNPQTYLIVGITVLLAGILCLFGLPGEPLDLSKDEGPFPSILMPPQSVYGNGYMDGGSVAVHIVDRSGVEYELTFPIDYDGIRNAHPTAFFGNMNDPKKIFLKDPERAKKIAIRLLDDYGKEMNYPGVVEGCDFTARARRALASPPYVVAFRAYEKVQRFLP